MSTPTEIQAANLGDVNSVLNGHANADGTLKASALRSGLNATLAPDWLIITQYKAGQYVVRAGKLLLCVADHTSPATYAGFDATKWSDTGVTVAAEPIQRLTFRGEATGGDTYDTTPHLTFESYQRPLGGPFGESIRFKNMNPTAKTMLSWWQATDPSQSPDDVTNPMRQMVWAGAHYAAENDGSPVHGHWSVEVVDSTLALQSRFGIDWIKQTDLTPGVDVSSAYFSKTDVSIRQGEGEVLRLTAGAGSAERVLEFSSSSGTGVSPGSFDTTKKRWWILADSVAEAGAGAGSNLIIRSYQDDGTTAATVFYANRASGNVTFGNATDGGARVSAIWAGGANHGFYAVPSASPNSGFASFATKLFAVGDRAVDIRVAGDANPRMTVDGNGKHSWGNAAGATDITLQRLAAKVLGVGAAETFRTGVAVTGSRPSASSVGAGSQFYDSTLSKPIWSDGTNWKDATGTTV